MSSSPSPGAHFGERNLFLSRIRRSNRIKSQVPQFFVGQKGMHFPWPYTAKLCCLSAVWLNVQSHLSSLVVASCLSPHSGLWIVVGPASALALRHLICRVCCAWFGLEANAGKTTIGGLAARGCGERPSRKNGTSYRRLKPPRQKKSRCVRIMSWRWRWGEGSEHT